MEIKVLRNILEANELTAETVKQTLSEKKVFMINIMGSPGSGKTTLISALLSALTDFRAAVIEGDIETSKDAEKLASYDVPIVQINTSVFGGECHLEASWIQSSLQEMPLPDIDVVLVENVGNLVCPAEFEIGADLSLALLSIPEGEDKPVKYPLMFRTVDAVVLTKTSLSDVMEYSFDEVESNIRKVNGNIPIFQTDAKSHTGMDSLVKHIRKGILVKNS